MSEKEFIYLRDRRERPTKPIGPGDGGDDDGPKRPDVNKPDVWIKTNRDAIVSEQVNSQWNIKGHIKAIFLTS